MRPQPPTPRRRSRRAGFTLVELLLSAALVGLLLSAVAAAMHASLTSYEENTKAAALNQTTRTLLMRMRREIRTAAAVNHEAEYNQLVIIPPEDGSGLQEIKYEYDHGTQTFYYRRKVNGQTSSQVILGAESPVRLSSFHVTYETAQDGQGLTYTERAIVRLYFEMDGRYFPMTCSAAPRRNQQY